MKAFTLLELVVVAAIITVIVGLTVPAGLSSYLTRSQIAREDAVLAELKRDIETSFEARDLAWNVSAVTGDVDGSVAPTEFSTSTAPTYASLTGNEWLARVGRARGLSPTIGQPVTVNSQPALYDLITTAGGRSRLLFAAPIEPDKQRYVLVSVIGRDDELVLPAYAPTLAWFAALWDTPWDRIDATLPASWVSALTPAQAQLWQTNTPGKTRLHRLRVVRITQRRHDVVINSLHPTDSAWVAYNTMTAYAPDGAAPARQLVPASGVTTLSGILAGRAVRIWVGQSWPTATPAEITVRERAGFVVQ